MNFEELLKFLFQYGYIGNAVSGVFIIYFYFKIMYEVKKMRLLLDNHINEIKNEIKIFKDELEIRDRKLNLYVQKFNSDIEKINEKLKTK